MKIEEIKEIMLEIADVLDKFPENLQEKVYDTIVHQLWKINLDQESKVDGTGEDLIMEADMNSLEKESNNIEKRAKKRSGSKENYQINKDLNLSPRDKKTLKQFVESKKPQSNIEFNAVVIYYMQKILNKEKVSIDDVYSCYKDMSRKVPNALKQSLTDTSSSKYGYIAVNNNFYSIPVKGENLVELELPRKK